MLKDGKESRENENYERDVEERQQVRKKACGKKGREQQRGRIKDAHTHNLLIDEY
jgi:hypothetical protein